MNKDCWMCMRPFVVDEGPWYVELWRTWDNGRADPHWCLFHKEPSVERAVQKMLQLRKDHPVAEWRVHNVETDDMIVGAIL